MQTPIDRNRVYLLLLYLLLSLAYAVIVLSLEQGSISLLLYLLVLIAFIVLTHEALLRAISQATGQAIPISELNFFNAFLDLNRKIHTLLEAGDVLSLVHGTLKERIYVSQTHYFVGEELLGTDRTDETQTHSTIHCWPDFRSYSFDLAELASEALLRKKVVAKAEASLFLKNVFEKTETCLMIPIIQNDSVLAILLIGRADNEKRFTDFELQAFSYLANQLTLILDRIRVYTQNQHRTAMDHAEKLQVMQSLSANIAHEMRTPLSGIRASITGIEEYLPQLLDCHHWSVETNPQDFQPIREDHVGALLGTPKRIMLMIDQANTVIDMLLMNLRENSLDRKQFNVIAAREIIENAMDRYPFKTGQREKISLDLSEDFSFLGIESLCIYILFNLLKNAFYAIQSVQKGVITIQLQLDGFQGLIIFRDTGMGIDPAIQQRIFDGFFTTKQEGTGAGLVFCKRTVESFGGSIACHSIPGEYAEFVIRLPVIAH